MEPGVLFDLFGTLVIPQTDVARVGRVSESLARSFESLGLDLSGVDVDAIESEVWDVELLPREDGATPFEVRLASFAFHRLGTRLPATRFRQAADSACEVFQSALMVDPTAEEVLTNLAASRVIGLVTNYDHPPHIRSLLATTVIGELMQDVVISGDVGLWKPDPAILHLACKRLGLNETETLYVGDSIADYKAASAAGLSFAWIHRTERDDRDEEEAMRLQFAETDSMLRRLGEEGEILLISSLVELIDRI